MSNKEESPTLVSADTYLVKRSLQMLSTLELLQILKNMYLHPPFGVLDEPILKEIIVRCKLWDASNHL